MMEEETSGKAVRAEDVLDAPAGLAGALAWPDGVLGRWSSRMRRLQPFQPAEPARRARLEREGIARLLFDLVEGQ